MPIGRRPEGSRRIPITCRLHACLVRSSRTRQQPGNIAGMSPGGPAGWSPNRVRSGRLPIRSHPINPIRSSPAGGVRELHGSGRCTLPFRGGNIEGRPAGGGPGFSRDGRHVSGYGPGSGRAARAVRGRCGRLRAALWRLRDALPGSTGNGFVSGALSHRDTPAILASSFLVSTRSIRLSEF